VTYQSFRQKWHRLIDSDEEGMREKLADRSLDTKTPNVARIYDFLLGGKENFAADRDAAERVMQEIPHAALTCRQNRDFLGRAVRVLADAGIRQYLDIGSGLPARDNVHEIVQRTDPHARIAYVDYDPVVVAHSRVLLEKGSPGVLVIEADLRDPEKIIGEAQGLLDFTEPVAVLLFAVLHFLTDEDDPHGIVRSLTEPLVPGSAVAVSHITDEGVGPETSLAVQKVYQGASAPAVPRSRRDITRFFDGLELIEPGATDINLWPARAAGPGAPVTLYGGAALKR
jgi:hypothetical protein